MSIAVCRSRLVLAVLAFGAACPLFSQTQPAFEAASVKPNTSGSGSSRSNGSKGQTIFINVTLRQLVMRAYSIMDFQLIGPDWMANLRFDLAFKYPGDTDKADEPDKDRRALMLQTLLAERFHLAVHRESKEMPAFALLPAKGGPKLTDGRPGGASTKTNRGRFEDEGVSMAGLAEQLAQQLEHPVVDKTGLPGVYNLKLEWTPDDASGDQAPGPSIFAALQEQLGLKLQTQKSPVDIVVVDRVDRTPVEN
jgi:uncharacterized protein (TIGR03435 family)